MQSRMNVLKRARVSTGEATAGQKGEAAMGKYAVLSMDVEDWYHNDYFLNAPVNKNHKMHDGIDVFLKILDDYTIEATFFVLAEILDEIRDKIREIADRHHEVACHGLAHTRPLLMAPGLFRKQMVFAKELLVRASGQEVVGYRAPTYGLDDAHFKIIRELGFQYDSSRIGFKQNSKYGSFDISAFTEGPRNIYRDGDFFEFEISTQEAFGMQVPLGGGYFRMLPWAFTKRQLQKHCLNSDVYVLYVHPFELSRFPVPMVDGVGMKARIRSTLGRDSVEGKIRQTIEILKEQGFEFITFRRLRERLIISHKRTFASKAI